MSFAERLIHRRVRLVLLNSVLTLAAIAVVEAADLNPLWVVAAALASGAVSIGAIGLAPGPGQGTSAPRAPSGSPPTATLPG